MKQKIQTLENMTDEELIRHFDEIMEQIESGEMKTYPAREVLKELTEKYLKKNRGD